MSKTVELARHLEKLHICLLYTSSSIYIRDESGRVCAIFCINFDISALAMAEQALAGLTSAHPAGEETPRITHKVNDLLDDLKMCIRDSLQVTRRVARNEADGNGGADALAPAGVWDDDAFDVFQNVAADGGVHPLGQCAQQLPKGRGAVGNGDRLRAAGRRDELLAQDIKIIPVSYTHLDGYKRQNLDGSKGV